MINFKEKPKRKDFKDIEGKKFGKLNIIGYAGTFGDIKKRSYWWTQCDCGSYPKKYLLII